jgi:hypothetical protein
VIYDHGRPITERGIEGAMAVYGRSDDLVIALRQAVTLYAAERFDKVADACGHMAATAQVLETADAFVAWLRRPATVNLTLVAIEEIDTGQVVPPTGGPVTIIDTSQRARYVINSADDRGFPVDATLQATATPEGIVTLELIDATTGTDSGKDELVASFAGLGATLVKVFDPANPDTVFGSDNIEAQPGGVAVITLGSPTIEEIPPTT